MERCGKACELEPEEQADVEDAEYAEALVKILSEATTEQLIEALKNRGYNRVILEDS